MVDISKLTKTSKETTRATDESYDDPVKYVCTLIKLTLSRTCVDGPPAVKYVCTLKMFELSRTCVDGPPARSFTGVTRVLDKIIWKKFVRS